MKQISLGELSLGYPLLDLSRKLGVPYRSMLDLFERWCDGDRLIEPFNAWFKELTLFGVLRHPSIRPMWWPTMGSGSTVRTADYELVPYLREFGALGL